jgi:uncharacterized membrane protein YdjX (TVP38/TMEM64 family)
LLALLALAIGVASLEPVHEVVHHALEWSKAFIADHQVLGIGLFVLLSAISAIAFFFSTAMIVPVAVFAWGKPTTMLLLWGSWLAGAAVSYWIGLRPGRKLARWIAPGRRVALYEKKLSKSANFPLVVLFQIAVPSEIPGYVLGALRYPFGRYLGARALAEVPFAIGAVYLGDSFVRRQYGQLAVLAVAGVALSAAAIVLLQRHLARG